MARAQLFLVRHPDDASAAELLSARLESEGFDLWSERDLLPGDLVVEEREKALRSCAGGVVLISSRSLDAWEAESLQVLIRRAVQLEGFVVPVLTGNEVSLPPYLSAREPGRIDKLDELVLGIRKRLNGVHEKSVLPESEPGKRLRTNIRSPLRLVGRTEEIAALEAWFEDTSRSATGVIYGPPGTGRTGLAEWWGTTHLHQYPGGVFRVPATQSPFDGLMRVAQQAFELRAVDFKHGGPLSVLERFAREATLLIFDDLRSEDALQIEGEPLLPSMGQPIHVLATSTAIDWSPHFKYLRLGPLDRPEALSLVRVLDDPQTLDGPSSEGIVDRFGGYPAVLVPVILTLERTVMLQVLDADGWPAVSAERWPQARARKGRGALPPSLGAAPRRDPCRAVCRGMPAAGEDRRDHSAGTLGDHRPRQVRRRSALVPREHAA